MMNDNFDAILYKSINNNFSLVIKEEIEEKLDGATRFILKPKIMEPSYQDISMRIDMELIYLIGRSKGFL